MSRARWRVVGRRIVIAVKALYHGISLVGLTEDTKTLWTGIGSIIAPAILRFQQVREWLLDRTTYLFALEQIGEYGPWASASIFLLVLMRRAYLRGLPDVLEAEGLTEPEPATPDVTEVDEFRQLANQMTAVYEYMVEANMDPNHHSAALEGSRWEIRDRLNSLGIEMPKLSDCGQLLGLMRTGNLERAKRKFPTLLSVLEEGVDKSRRSRRDTPK